MSPNSYYNYKKNRKKEYTETKEKYIETRFECNRINPKLAIDPLQLALSRNTIASNIILHSDQGS